MATLVFAFIKDYISEYLFGFDKKQFKMSIIAGDASISKANVKPDKVNELLDEYNYPFVVKAGMIRDLRCRINKLQLVHELFTKNITQKLFGGGKDTSDEDVVDTPVTVEWDEILLILGPSLKYMTNHENTNMEDNIDDAEESMEVVDLDTYDTFHYLKMIESRLRHRLLKQKRQEKLDRKKKAKEAIEERRKRTTQEEFDPESIIKNFSLVLKLLNISINKVHIRYEEDYFVMREPYSFGLVVSSISLKSFDKDIKFKTPIDVTYEEFYPSNKKNLQLK